MNVRRTSGFTLIELLLAIGILGLILTMLAVSFAAVSVGQPRLAETASHRLDVELLRAEARRRFAG